MQTLIGHYFGFSFGNALGGILSVLLKMPFERTLLHFTCLSCRNSAYSWNKTIQSSKLHTLPNRRGVGVCVNARPDESNHSNMEGSKIALAWEFPKYRWGRGPDE